MWKNMLQPDKSTWHALWCWVTKVTDAHSQYAICIALPQQQLLRERWTLRSYVNCLFCLRWGVVSSSPYLRLWDYFLSALYDCLFSVFAATVHIWRPSASETWGHAILWWKEVIYTYTINTYSNTDILRRSQCPRGLRCRSAATRLLRLWFRIPPGTWMSVCYESCLFSGRGLCDELITGVLETLVRRCVCDLETSRIRRSWPSLGHSTI